MRLALAFPPPWRIMTAPGDLVAAVLPGAGIPDAVVTYGPLQLVPDEPRAWHDAVARRDIPADANVVVGRARDLQTVDGWPLRLVEAEVRTAAGELIEIRLCAFFTFLEHAAAVIARTQSAAMMSAHGPALLDVLRAGRPDWRGVQPACLAHAWDLAPRQTRRRALPEAAADLPTLIAATTRTPDDEASWYALGLAHGSAGDHAAAIAAWERAVALAPDRADTHYNLAQARYLTKDITGALASFERVVALDPGDVLVLRKLAQCLHALGRDDEAVAVRARLRDAWARSGDPRVRLVSEYVCDQFEVDGHRVLATETLRPRDPTIYTLQTFRGDGPLPTVVVQTSDRAKAAGTPYVLGVIVEDKLRVVSTLSTLPAYAALKQQAIALMRSPPTAPA